MNDVFLVRVYFAERTFCTCMNLEWWVLVYYNYKLKSGLFVDLGVMWRFYSNKSVW